MKLENDLQPIAVIGLGNMGQALAAAYMDAGHPVTVWNRSADKADKLADSGAKRAASAAAAIAASHIVIVCLSTYEAVRSTLVPLKAQLADRTIVNLTTGTPDEARSLAAWARDNGIDYMNGAIMAVPPMIGSPDALILYGGRKKLFENILPILQVLGGETTFLSEDAGVPMLFDMAMLTMLYGAWYSYLHAHALLRTADITAERFLPYATNWLQQLIVPSLTSADAARILDERNYATDVSNLTVNKQALDHIVNSSRELGVPADWLLPIQTAANRMIALGYGNDGFERVIETMIAGER